MQLRHLSMADMVVLSQGYIDPAHPAHKALVKIPEVAALLANLREVHETLFAGQAQDKGSAGSKTEVERELVREQENLMYGTRCLFRSLILTSQSADERANWEHLRDVLLLGERGGALTLPQLAGASAALMQQLLNGLSPADQKLLKDQPLGKRSVYEIIERWIEIGKELAPKELETRTLPLPQTPARGLPLPPAPAIIQTARKRWALIVGAIVAMLEMDDPAVPLSADIKEHFLEPLRAATERASAPSEPADDQAMHYVTLQYSTDEAASESTQGA